MTAQTQAQRSTAFYARRVANGWKQVILWVRADKVPELREFAKGLHDGSKPTPPV